MFNTFLTLIRYDILETMRKAHSWATPLLFFVMVTFVFSFVFSKDPELAHKAAPGIIWVAVLLSILMSLTYLFERDAKEGLLELWLLSPYPLTLLVFCKIVSHWITHCLPLILISPFLGFLLNLSFYEIGVLMMTLLLGTPVFILLGSIGSALLIGIRGHGLLLPILMMPLYIPTLIFGTEALLAANMHQEIAGSIALMGALFLLSLGFAPSLTSIALRMGVDS